MPRRRPGQAKEEDEHAENVEKLHDSGGDGDAAGNVVVGCASNDEGRDQGRARKPGLRLGRRRASRRIFGTRSEFLHQDMWAWSDAERQPGRRRRRRCNEHAEETLRSAPTTRPSAGSGSACEAADGNWSAASSRRRLLLQACRWSGLKRGRRQPSGGHTVCEHHEGIPRVRGQGQCRRSGRRSDSRRGLRQDRQLTGRRRDHAAHRLSSSARSTSRTSSLP